MSSFASWLPIRSPSEFIREIYNFAYIVDITVFLLTHYSHSYNSIDMDGSSSPLLALKNAIAIAGGQSALARMCSVSQPTVWGWLHRIGHVPAEHVLIVEAGTGISKHDLRPDIYPRDAGPHLPGGASGTGAGGEQSTPARAETSGNGSDPLSGLTA